MPARGGMASRQAPLAAEPPLNPVLVDPVTVGVDPVMLQEYSDAMHALVKQGTIPGCASIVVRKGQVIHTAEYGSSDLERKKPFRMDTLCRIFCTTKSYIAVAFMTLVDEGVLGLEDRVDRYLPVFKNARVLAGDATKSVPLKRPLLLKHLLAHTSGIGYPVDVGEEPEGHIAEKYVAFKKAMESERIVSLKAFVRELAKVPLLCHPGDNYNYGYSMDVLAHLVECVTGQDIEVVLQQRVFEPLGMRDTKWYAEGADLDRLAACYAKPATWGATYGDNEQGDKMITPRPGLVRIDGATPEESGWTRDKMCKIKLGGGFLNYIRGGLLSTVNDTLSFVQMLVQKGLTPGGQRMLKEKSVVEMEKNRCKKAWGQGKTCYIGNIAVFREGGTEYGMGGAACTYWSVDRAEDVAAVWFTQHCDMPDYPELTGVDVKRADLWAAMYDAVRSKRLKQAKGTGAAAAKARREMQSAAAKAKRDMPKATGGPGAAHPKTGGASAKRKASAASAAPSSAKRARQGAKQ